MERSGVARWLLLGLAVIFFIVWGPKLFGGGETALQPLKAEFEAAAATRAPERICDVWGPRFRAQLTTQGASLKHFWLLDAKYQRDGKPIDLSTTPDVEMRRQLRLQWRNEALGDKPDVAWQTRLDAVDWQIESSDGKSCVFVYQDEEVRLRKTVGATERPYELRVEAEVENLAEEKRRHALSVRTVAWRTNDEVQGGMFTVSPFITHVECVMQEETIRLQPGDFDPDEFSEPVFAKGPLNPGDWHQPPGDPQLAAVSNHYFTHALVPEQAPPQAKPVCQLQIEQRWDVARYKEAGADPNAGAMYRARLAYPAVDLASGESAKYVVLSYVGPKERELLAAAAGGNKKLDELIDLGYFAAIAKVLVAFLGKVYSLIPNWGIAIIILTITARTLLFPLSWPSIKSMIKMRELKPELDALSEKYKGDPQARGLAQMELWRKHNVNPLKGCLPQLASMPVWFALYATLQTAVELYNIPFLWFPDLSQPDPYYVLPVVIGGTSYVQQKLMPMQGDPAQQKMMLYFMPAMFTVFMLFLPAGLGVYMFTNGLLGIAQQQVVEWHVRRTTARGAEQGRGGGDGGAQAKASSGSSREGRARKGKGAGSQAELSDGRPLLGKGKA